MKKKLLAEKCMIEELSEVGKKVLRSARNLSIGELLKIIRKQLGMSQRALSKKSRVSQSQISSIERGNTNITLSTVEKLSQALSCHVLIVPVLADTIDNIRLKQAKQLAAKKVNYLKGTMALEMQEPDAPFSHLLLQEEVNDLLHDSSSKLWDDI